jgi:hypothetical protein
MREKCDVCAMRFLPVPEKGRVEAKARLTEIVDLSHARSSCWALWVLRHTPYDLRSVSPKQKGDAVGCILPKKVK